MKNQENIFSAYEKGGSIRQPKNAFDEIGVKKLPKVKDLQAEYAKLLEEKKKTYAEYRRSREEMRRGKSRQDFSLCGPSVLTPALLATFVLTFVKITAALLSIRPLKLPSEYHLHSYPHLLRHLSEHPHA